MSLSYFRHAFLHTQWMMVFVSHSWSFYELRMVQHLVTLNLWSPSYIDRYLDSWAFRYDQFNLVITITLVWHSCASWGSQLCTLDSKLSFNWALQFCIIFLCLPRVSLTVLFYMILFSSSPPDICIRLWAHNLLERNEKHCRSGAGRCLIHSSEKLIVWNS